MRRLNELGRRVLGETRDSRKEAVDPYADEQNGIVDRATGAVEA